MKTSLFVSLIVLSSSLSSFAQVTSKKDTATVSAAATMLAGYGAVKGYVKVSDIEKRFTRVVFQADNRFLDPEHDTVGIKKGDTVRITYSQNDRLQVIEGRLSRLHPEIQQLKAMAIEEAELGMRYSKDQFRFFHFEKANPAAAKEHFGKAMYLDSLLSKKVAEYNSSVRAIQDMHQPKTLVIKNADPIKVSAKLGELRDLRYSVYTVKRVPGLVLNKMAKVSKGGVLLAATAITMGLVTAEEITSGKIASKLDAEFSDLKK